MAEHGTLTPCVVGSTPITPANIYYRKDNTMPKFVYIEDDPYADYLPDKEVMEYRKRQAGFDVEHNIRTVVNIATALPEDSMAFHFLMSQDPWDDDWGN